MTTTIIKFSPYNKYINPWIRLLILIILLGYWIMVSFSILSYRNVAFIHDLLNIERQQGLNVTSSSYSNYANGQFVLKDLGFNLIPTVSGSVYNSWQFFTNFTPWFFLCLTLFLNLFVYKDIIRIMEFGGSFIVLLFLNSIVHLLTTYPDAGGNLDAGCTNPQYNNEGSYFAWNNVFNYCGDMM